MLMQSVVIDINLNLNITETIDYTGALATAVGWGRTGETKPVSNELRKVNLPILSQEECDQAGYAKDRITENMFCAGYILHPEGAVGRDACFVSVNHSLK